MWFSRKEQPIAPAEVQRLRESEAFPSQESYGSCTSLGMTDDESEHLMADTPSDEFPPSDDQFPPSDEFLTPDLSDRSNYKADIATGYQYRSVQ